jgi:hypothetical protein
MCPHARHFVYSLPPEGAQVRLRPGVGPERFTKTSYDQDIRSRGTAGMCSGTACCAFLIAAPWVIDEYWLAQLTFVLIYGIVGLGLMLLAGFTGCSPSAMPPSSASAPTRRAC